MIDRCGGCRCCSLHHTNVILAAIWLTFVAFTMRFFLIELCLVPAPLFVLHVFAIIALRIQFKKYGWPKRSIETANPIQVRNWRPTGY